MSTYVTIKCFGYPIFFFFDQTSVACSIQTSQFKVMTKIILSCHP
jgi:hypothetical protein